MASGENRAEQFVHSLNLSDDQFKFMVELVLLLTQTGSLNERQLWHEYQSMFKRSPSCKDLKVTTRSAFLLHVKDLIHQEKSSGRCSLTEVGKEYAMFILGKTNSMCKEPTGSTGAPPGLQTSHAAGHPQPGRSNESLAKSQPSFGQAPFKPLQSSSDGTLHDQANLFRGLTTPASTARPVDPPIARAPTVRNNLGTGAKPKVKMDGWPTPEKAAKPIQRATPPGGEPFLLETEFPELSDNPKTVTKDRLEAMAVKNIDTIADQGEFVTPRRVELLLCEQLGIRTLSDLKQVRLRRGIDDLQPIRDLSRKIGQLEAHITASVALRNVNTISDLLEGLREGIPDKKPYESLKLGPITKFPVVQRLFGVPSGAEVIEISCGDVYEHLRTFVSKENLWTAQVKSEDFVDYMKTTYELDDVFGLGVMIKSIPLCMQIIKRAQRQQAKSVKDYCSTVESQCSRDLEAVYESFRMKIMVEARSQGGYTAKQHYLSLPSREVVRDVFAKFQNLITTLSEMGQAPLMRKEEQAIEQTKKLLDKSKLVQNLFKYSVICSSEEVVTTLSEFMNKLIGEKQEEEKKKEKSEKIPKQEISKRLLQYVQTILDNGSSLSLKLLKDIELRCAKHFKRNGFIDLGHETFLEFLLKDETIPKLLDENGGIGLGGCGATESSVYRPTQSDLTELAVNVQSPNDSTIERVCCYHYKVNKFSDFGVGSIKTLLDRVEKANRRPRNVVCEASFCSDSVVMKSKGCDYGVSGPTTVNQALKCLQECPLMEDLGYWSQWDLVFAQQHGALKDFVEKHGGSGHFRVDDKEIEKDIAAIEIEPGHLLRLPFECGDDEFRSIVEVGVPTQVCGHLVKLIVSRGLKTAGISLLSNVVSAHLHKISAVIPGGPPCEGTTNPAVMFVRDCLTILPLMFSEMLANDVFLTPLSQVFGQSESKRLLVKSCHDYKHINRLFILGQVLGIGQWQNLSKAQLIEGAPDSNALAGDDSGSYASSEDGQGSDWSTDSEDETENKELTQQRSGNCDSSEQREGSVSEKCLQPSLVAEDECSADSFSEGKRADSVESDVQQALVQGADDRNGMQDVLSVNTDSVMNAEASTDTEVVGISTTDVGDALLDSKISETVSMAGKGAMSIDLQVEASDETMNDEFVGEAIDEADDLLDSLESEEQLSEDSPSSDERSDTDDDGVESDSDHGFDLTDEERQCKKVIDSIRRTEFGCGVKLDETARLLVQKQQDKLKRSLQRLSQDLYTKDTHFVLELVQNADDNSYDVEEKCPSLQFIIDKDNITILNNELGFEERNVRALCDVGNSTKPKHKFGYIGQKGIGFKSVFRITDKPEIHSNGYHFCFNMQEDEIGYILPNWVEDGDKDDLDTKWRTRIVLPMKLEMKRNVQTLTNRFRDIHPSLLLFLHRLKSITVENRIEGTKSRMVRKDLGKRTIEIKHNKKVERWLVQRRRVDVSKLEIQIKGGVEVQETEIALAFPVRDSAKIPESQAVFAFLPLRVYGFRFVIQADFDLPSSREDLDSDSAWNQWLRKEIAPTFVESLNSFKASEENIITGIKKFLMFVATEDEVMEFFKPVAKDVLRQLSGNEFLPSEGEVLKLPSQLVMGADNFVRKTFPNTMLEKYLNLSYIHPDIVTEQNRQLLQRLGVKTLLTTDILNLIRALTVEWKGRTNDAIMPMIARILVCVQRTLNEFDLEDKTVELMREMYLIPDSEGKLLSLKEQAVFFPIERSKKHFSRILASDLSVVHPDLMNLLEKVENSQVVDALEKLGVKHITPKEVIEHHILPVFSTDKWKTKAPDTLKKYVIFLHEFEEDLVAVINFKDLSQIIQLSTNQGLKNPSHEFIHFTQSWGNKIDLRTTLPNYKWCLLDHYAPVSKPSLSFRQFFEKLGIIDFIGVRKVVKELRPSDLANTIWKDSFSQLSAESVEIVDWVSEELEGVIMNRSLKDYHQMQELFVLLAVNFSCFKRYLEAEFSQSGNRHHTISSFAHLLTSEAWIPGRKKSVDGSRYGIREEFYLGKDLYAPVGNCPHLLAFHVPYLDIQAKMKIDYRILEGLSQFLRIHGHVECHEVKEFFLQWIKDEFTTDVDHMAKVYSYFNSAMTGYDRQQLFVENKAIFVPERENMESKTVTGRFHALSDVCWHDPSGMFDKYKEEWESNSSASIQTLSLYPNLYTHRDILPRLIPEQPSLNLYVELLEVICTYHPKCSSKFEDVVTVYGVVHSQIEKIPGESWRQSFENRRVIPSKKDKYVKFSEHPMISDHERIEKLFAESENVHFLDLCPGQKRSRLQKQKHRLDQLQDFFSEILKLKPLTECFNEEIISEGIRPFHALQNYLHHVVPNLQKYILQEDDSAYDSLRDKGVRDFLQKLKFYSVGRLEAVYTLKYLTPAAVKTETRKCHIHEDGGDMYVHKDAMKDDKSIQEAITEFFSCGDGSLSAKLHVFLMTVFPSVENPLKNYQTGIRGYKLKNLPDNEEVWEVAEAIVLHPPPVVLPPPTPEPAQMGPSDNSEPVLKCWPPPAPGSESGLGKGTGSTSWPKPPKPDSIPDELPEKIKMYAQGQRRAAPDSSSASTGEPRGGERVETTSGPIHRDHNSQHTPNIPRDPKFPERAKVEKISEKVEGVRKMGGDVAVTDPVSGGAPASSQGHREVGQGATGHSAVFEGARKTDPLKNAAMDASTVDKLDKAEAPVKIGPLPMGPSGDHGGSAHQGAPQTVRRFERDDIDDIPDERVFLATGTAAELSQTVEIRLDAAASQKDIGRCGEEIVYKYLSARIGQQIETEVDNVNEIIQSVKWMNQNGESELPYDLVLTSVSAETNEEKAYYIEVKSTVSDTKMYFETSAKQLSFAGENRGKYDLYRVFSVGNKDKVKLIKLRNVAKALEDKSIRVFMVV